MFTASRIQEHRIGVGGSKAAVCFLHLYFYRACKNSCWILVRSVWVANLSHPGMALLESAHSYKAQIRLSSVAGKLCVPCQSQTAVSHARCTCSTALEPCAGPLGSVTKEGHKAHWPLTFWPLSCLCGGLLCAQSTFSLLPGPAS